MEKDILTIEEAVSRIEKSLDSAETRFRSKYNRYPSLLKEEDYFLFREFFNLKREIEKHKTLNEVKRNKKYAFVGDYLIDSHNFEYGLLRRFLENEGFFRGENQKQIFDAVMGRLIYKPPSREYRLRIDAGKKLLEKNIKFPRDWDLFLDTIKTICEGGTKRCPDGGVWSYASNKGAKVGMLLPNVGGWFLSSLKRGLRNQGKRSYEDFKDIISTWEKYANPKLDFSDELYICFYK